MARDGIAGGGAAVMLIIRYTLLAMNVSFEFPAYRSSARGGTRFASGLTAPRAPHPRNPPHADRD